MMPQSEAGWPDNLIDLFLVAVREFRLLRNAQIRKRPTWSVRVVAEYVPTAHKSVRQQFDAKFNQSQQLHDQLETAITKANDIHDAVLKSNGISKDDLKLDK